MMGLAAAACSGGAGGDAEATRLAAARSDPPARSRTALPQIKPTNYQLTGAPRSEIVVVPEESEGGHTGLPDPSP
jgi:hypothetical protein